MGYDWESSDLPLGSTVFVFPSCDQIFIDDSLSMHCIDKESSQRLSEAPPTLCLI